MSYRSGKIQFLFWAAFFAIIFYLWLIGVGLVNFVFVDDKSLNPPQNVIILMFVLYGLLIIDILAGIFVSTMINNKYYQRFFGVLLMIAFLSFLVVKGMFG